MTDDSKVVWHPITFTDPRVTHTDDVEHIRNGTVQVNWMTRAEIEAKYGKNQD